MSRSSGSGVSRPDWRVETGGLRPCAVGTAHAGEIGQVVGETGIGGRGGGHPVMEPARRIDDHVGRPSVRSAHGLHPQDLEDRGAHQGGDDPGLHLGGRQRSVGGDQSGASRVVDRRQRVLDAGEGQGGREWFGDIEYRERLDERAGGRARLRESLAHRTDDVCGGRELGVTACPGPGRYLVEQGHDVSWIARRVPGQFRPHRGMEHDAALSGEIRGALCIDPLESQLVEGLSGEAGTGPSCRHDDEDATCPVLPDQRHQRLERLFVGEVGVVDGHEHRDIRRRRLE